MNKHIRLRIESWCKKFCLITSNIEWKKNRNLHAKYLLNMIINRNFEDPYTKFAPEGPLPFLSKPLINSKLSPKFLKYISNTFNLPLSAKNKRSFSNNQLNVSKNYYNNKAKSPKTQRETILNKNNNINYKNNFNEIIKCNDPDLLKKLIGKLQKKVDETRIIIEKQNEENKTLLKKITQLESIIKTY